MDQRKAVTSAGAPASDAASAWVYLTSVEDLRGGGPFALAAGGHDLVLLRTATGFKAYEGRCPHQGALLGEGEMDGTALVCRNHRWRFSSVSGRRLGGPQCLTTVPVELRGDAVWVQASVLDSVGHATTGTPGRNIDDLPHKPNVPLLGNLLLLDLGNLHQILERWAGEFGGPFTYRVGPYRVLALADPAHMATVLRARPETFRRAATLEPIFREIGLHGVFSAEGAEWRAQRKLAMHALSARHLRGFYPTLADVLRRLRVRWEAKARAGATLDIADELKRFTVDSTTLLVLGHDVDTIGGDEDVIQRKLEHVFPALNRRLFAIFATWRWFRTPRDRRLDRAVAELRVWFRQLLEEARARVAADPARASAPENFLESMIAARDAEGRPFSEEIIFGNLLTMLLAGEDTTAYTLAWAVHHLCDAPEAVARLRAESDALLAGEATPADMEAVSHLAYAGAVANETMRLRPVAPLLLFEANHDTQVGGIAVPQGHWVTLLNRLPAINRANFGDPDEFRPERWVEDAATGGAHDPSAHMPFGSGPRICPGRSLALTEMKMLLAMLYGSFEVARVGDAAGVREQFSFTMSPVGLRVRLSPRSSAATRRST
jgi:cytochrome P450/nitrite reductase/ring-hydroxylating ferredoxin subunit